MATKGYVATLINTLPREIRQPLQSAYEYVLDGWKLSDGPRAQNAQWFKLTAITSSVANEEFSLVHGLDAAPLWLIPVMDLTSSGHTLVPLTVTRAADAKRVYLASSSTSAAITFFLEPS